MSVNFAANEVVKYFSALTATSPITISLGTTLVLASNLFIGVEPQTATNMITVIPYGSTPPIGRKYESNLQIRIKANSMQKVLKTSQAVINAMDRNLNVCASKIGVLLAQQSNPILLPPLENGEWQLGVVNFIVKHIRF